MNRSIKQHLPKINPALKLATASEALNDVLDKSDLKMQSISSTTFELFETAISLSPYLKDCLKKELEFACAAFDGNVDHAFDQLISNVAKSGVNVSDEAEFMASLRVAKRRVALICGLCDLSGEWHDQKITKTLSRFAQASLSASFDFLLLQNHHSGKLELKKPDEPQSESGLIVLGMGKFGADELNYSSDIDIIIFYEETSGMRLLTDDPTTLLNRMMKLLIKLMQERTSDGYVFRTDLRLRPDPSSTPLVILAEAALNYYEGQGQNWERAAMIKATAVCGDIAAGKRFLEELKPFIWRKYLDFAAIQDVHSIKRQIHAHKGHGDIKVAGHNIKLGRGGIREIEFFAQTQQLIAGGRNPDLRKRETTKALDSLVDHGWIEVHAAEELKQAYWFLRGLEHRLQMINDQQTHTMPDAKPDVAVVAAMSGYENPAKFSEDVETVLRAVERHYANLFEQAQELSSGQGNLVFTGDDDDPDTILTLANLGFRNPAEIIKIIKQWHVAKMPALQTGAARELLTELIPGLLEAFANAPEPDKVMFMFDRFLAGLPAGIQLFAILKSNPALNTLLVRILIAAPAVAEQISRKPHVFDGMLERQFSDDLPSREELENALLGRLETQPLYEQKLDAARRFFQEVRFQIACRFIGHTLDHRQTAEALSNLAEALLSILLNVVKQDFSAIHGDVAGAKTCIVAMGRLGSRELTAGSDLDLIFLYDFDNSASSSDGSKPLDPTVYFMRFMKRFITAMTAPTAEGALYDLDFRLRPSGNAGPLATHIEGFLKYQREEAWVWEAQALTRARPVAGDEELCNRISTEIPKLLALRTDHIAIATEIYDMRMRVEKEKGTKLVWDMKTSPGGLLDIEFIAQWIMLAKIDRNDAATNTKEMLLGSGSTIAENEREHLLSAYDAFSVIIHLQRTCYANYDPASESPEGFEAMACSALDLPDLKSCEAHLVELKETTREIFNDLLSPAGRKGQSEIDGGELNKEKSHEP